MYCKNCGRQLKEGMRFCDRCGQSVRKNKESSQAARHREIEELKAERLNRKKRLAEKEAKQAMSKKRKKKKSKPFIFVITIILIAIASVLIGYYMFPGGDTVTLQSNTDESQNGVLQSPASTTGTDSNVKSGYSEITLANISCPYPSSFKSNTTTGNEKLNLTDALGGAGMIISQEAKSGEPKDLMKEYITAIGASGDPEMHAGSEWYSVTATANGIVYHRKCIVKNGLAVYYDFTYDVSSSASSKYEDYIKYIDSNFKLN